MTKYYIWTGVSEGQNGCSCHNHVFVLEKKVGSVCFKTESTAFYKYLWNMYDIANTFAGALGVPLSHICVFLPSCTWRVFVEGQCCRKSIQSNQQRWERKKKSPNESLTIRNWCFHHLFAQKNELWAINCENQYTYSQNITWAREFVATQYCQKHKFKSLLMLMKVTGSVRMHLCSHFDFEEDFTIFKYKPLKYPLS